MSKKPKEKKIAGVSLETKSSKFWMVLAIVNFILALGIVGYIIATSVVNKPSQNDGETPQIIARYSDTTKERFNKALSGMFGLDDSSVDNSSFVNEVTNKMSGQVIDAWAQAFEEAQIPESTFYEFVSYLEDYYNKFYVEDTCLRFYFEDYVLDKALKSAGLDSTYQYEQSNKKMISYQVDENSTSNFDYTKLTDEEKLKVAKHYAGYVGVNYQESDTYQTIIGNICNKIDDHVNPQTVDMNQFVKTLVIKRKADSKDTNILSSVFTSSSDLSSTTIGEMQTYLKSIYGVETNSDLNAFLTSFKTNAPDTFKDIDYNRDPVNVLCQIMDVQYGVVGIIPNVGVTIDTSRLNVYIDFIVDEIAKMIVDIRHSTPVAGEDQSLIGLIIEVFEELNEIGLTSTEMGKIIYHGIDLTLGVINENQVEYLRFYRDALDKIASGTLSLSGYETNIVSLIGTIGTASSGMMQKALREGGEEYYSNYFGHLIDSCSTIIKFFRAFSTEGISELKSQIVNIIADENDKNGIESAGKLVQNLFLSYKYQLDNELEYTYDDEGNRTGSTFFTINDNVYSILETLETITMATVSLSTKSAVNFHFVDPFTSAFETVVNTAGNVEYNILTVFEDLELCKQMALDMYLREIDREENRVFDLSDGMGLTQAINYLIDSANIDIEDRYSSKITGIYGINVSVDDMLTTLYDYFFDLAKMAELKNEYTITFKGTAIPIRSIVNYYRLYSYPLLLGKIIAKRNGMTLLQYDSEVDGSRFYDTFVNEVDAKNYLKSDDCATEADMREVLDANVTDDETVLKAIKSMIVRFYYYLDSPTIDKVDGLTKEQLHLKLLEVTAFKDVNQMVIPKEASDTEIIVLFKLIASAIMGEGDVLSISNSHSVMIEREGITEKFIGTIINNLVGIVSLNTDGYDFYNEVIKNFVLNNGQVDTKTYTTDEAKITALYNILFLIENKTKSSDGQQKSSAQMLEEIKNSHKIMGAEQNDSIDVLIAKYNGQVQGIMNVILPELSTMLMVPLSFRQATVNGVTDTYLVCEWYDGSLLTLAVDKDGLRFITPNDVYLDNINRYEYYLEASTADIKNDIVAIKEGRVLYRLKDSDDEYKELQYSQISENIIVSSMFDQVEISENISNSISNDIKNGKYTNLEGVYNVIATYYETITNKRPVVYGAFDNTSSLCEYIEKMLREIQLMQVIDDYNFRVTSANNMFSVRLYGGSSQEVIGYGFTSDYINVNAPYNNISLDWDSVNRLMNSQYEGQKYKDYSKEGYTNIEIKVYATDNTRFEYSSKYTSTSSASNIETTIKDVLTAFIEEMNKYRSDETKLTINDNYDFYNLLNQIYNEGKYSQKETQIKKYSFNINSSGISAGGNSQELSSDNFGKTGTITFKNYSTATLMRLLSAINSGAGGVSTIDTDNYDDASVLDGIAIAYGITLSPEATSYTAKLIEILNSNKFNGVTIASYYIDKFIEFHEQYVGDHNARACESVGYYTTKKSFDNDYYIYPNKESSGYSFIYYHMYTGMFGLLNKSNSPLKYEFITSYIKAIANLPFYVYDSQGNKIKFGEAGYYESLSSDGAMFYAYKKDTESTEYVVFDYDIDWNYDREVSYYFASEDQFYKAVSDTTRPEGYYLTDSENVLRGYYRMGASISTVFKTKQVFVNILKSNFIIEYATYSQIYENNALGIKESGYYTDLYDFISRSISEGVRVKFGESYIFYNVSQQFIYNNLYLTYRDIYSAIGGTILYFTEFPTNVLYGSLQQIIKDGLKISLPVAIEYTVKYSVGVASVAPSYIEKLKGLIGLESNNNGSSDSGSNSGSNNNSDNN